MSENKKNIAKFLFDNAAQGALNILALQNEYKKNYTLYFEEAKLYIPNEQIAENAVQDMFLEALRSPHHHYRDPEDVQLHLTAILRDITQEYKKEYKRLALENLQDIAPRPKDIGEQNLEKNLKEIRKKIIFETGLSTKEQIALTCQFTPSAKTEGLVTKLDIGPEDLESALEKVKGNKEIEMMYLKL